MEMARADRYQTISADWGVTNDFHEFAFGSDPDKNGDVWGDLVFEWVNKKCSELSWLDGESLTRRENDSGLFGYKVTRWE